MKNDMNYLNVLFALPILILASISMAAGADAFAPQLTPVSITATQGQTVTYPISFSTGTAANRPPVINSIAFAPQNADADDPVACSVSVSDADGNLRNVNFRWLLNGALVWDSNRLVSGPSATASDTYSGAKKLNDLIVCEARAYDSNGAYASANHAVRVGTVTISKPQITYVDITPRHPNPQQDLTCSVLATGANDNLDHVVFEWFSNGILYRSIDKYIGDGSASDVLDASRTCQGDVVKCKATVYDANGANDGRQSAAVTIGYGGGMTYPCYDQTGQPPYQPANDYQPIAYYPDPPQSNLRPVAVITANRQQAATGEVVLFSGSGSFDPDGSVVQYQFDYGDGYLSAWLPDLSYAHHSYSSPGTYYARVRVKDDAYLESSWSSAVVVQVRDQPEHYGNRPIAVLSANRLDVDTGESILFSGSGSFDPDGGPIAQYNFDFGDGGQTGWVSNLTVRHSYSEEGVYYARLMVRDDEGDESLWSYALKIIAGQGVEGSNSPVIDDIRLTKESGDNYVRFRCEVEAFDRNGDLDYVRFKWSLNGDLLSTERDEIDGETDEAFSEISIQTSSEDDSVKCEATVYDQKHNHASAERTVGAAPAPSPGTGCSLEAKRFDYVTYITEGMKGWAEMEARNAGQAGTLTMKLYVDGTQKDQFSAHLSASESASKRFEFPLSAGAHKVRIESSMACGARLNRTAEITVFQSAPPAFIPSGPGDGGGAALETTARITPSSLDIEINKGGIVSVYMQSQALARFNISVTGLPADWLNYPKEVDVKGGTTAFVYVVPKALGNYDFKVTVKTGSRTFEQPVSLYVAPASRQESGIGAGTGLIGALQGNWLTGLVIVCMLIFLTCLYFIAGKMKKKGKGYEDQVYGPRRPPHYGPYGPSSGAAQPIRPQPTQQMPAQQTQARQWSQVQPVQARMPAGGLRPQRPEAWANARQQPQPAKPSSQSGNVQVPLKSHTAGYMHPHELRNQAQAKAAAQATIPGWYSGSDSSDSPHPKYGKDFAKQPDHPFVHG